MLLRTEEKIDITVTERNLENAIANTKASNYRVCAMCVVGEALAEAFGERMDIGFTTIFRTADRDDLQRQPVYEVIGDGRLESMIAAFDSHRYHVVRAMLPLTFTIHKVQPQA